MTAPDWGNSAARDRAIERGRELERSAAVRRIQRARLDLSNALCREERDGLAMAAELVMQGGTVADVSVETWSRDGLTLHVKVADDGIVTLTQEVVHELLAAAGWVGGVWVVLSNRAPGTIWILRKIGAASNGSVTTTDSDKIAILYHPDDREAIHAQSLLMSRKDARLLARRVNQCLDATVKR